MEREAEEQNKQKTSGKRKILVPKMQSPSVGSSGAAAPKDDEEEVKAQQHAADFPAAKLRVCQSLLHEGFRNARLNEMAQRRHVCSVSVTSRHKPNPLRQCLTCNNLLEADQTPADERSFLEEFPTVATNALPLADRACVVLQLLARKLLLSRSLIQSRSILMRD